MNKWIRFVWCLWLAIVAAIVVVGIVRIYDGVHVSSVSWGRPMVTIDGAPAFVMQSSSYSKVHRAVGRAWISHTCWVVPASEMTGAPNDRTQYWRVVAVERPYHLTLEKQDGTRTGPHHVDFSALGVITWAPDGRSFAFSGGPGATGVFGAPNERLWNSDVVRQYTIEHVVAAGIVGVIIAIITAVLRARQESRERKYWYLCSKCGYDLRGSAAPGCPECGAGRPVH